MASSTSLTDLSLHHRRMRDAVQTSTIRIPNTVARMATAIFKAAFSFSAAEFEQSWLVAIGGVVEFVKLMIDRGFECGWY